MKLVRTVAILPLLVALFASGPPAHAQAPVKVKQAGFKVIDMAVPFIAKAQGFFDKNGLDWEYVEIDSGKLGVAALLSGNAQFTDFGVDDVAGLQKEGKDPVLVYSMVNSLTMDMVMRNDVMEKQGLTPGTPLTDKLKGLKGLTFGITRPGAVTQLFPTYLLRKAGLDPEKDVTFVQIGGGQALVAAMKAKRIDAFMLSAPAPYLLERDRVGTVILKNSAGEGPPEFGDFAFESIAVLKSWAAANPKIVEGYTRALNEAHEWMLANRPAALVHLKKYFPETDDATLRISFDALVPALRKGGRLTQSGIANQLNVMKAIGAIEVVPDTAEGGLWTNVYNK
jgi:ABC-type nitrate/sulfonate/bicarbonate transport system substrate-binding protein